MFAPGGADDGRAGPRRCSRLADPGWAEFPVKAVALLEPLERSQELVSALTELAAPRLLQGRSEAGLGYAEQALTLAEELGLPRPARALGYRALARCHLGDRGGLDDFREAITLATEAGQGREVALLHNNLAYALTPIDGPVAVQELLQAGIAFAEARGLTEVADMLRTTRSRPSSRRANTGRRSPSRTSSPRARGGWGRATSSRCGACRPRSSRCAGRQPR